LAATTTSNVVTYPVVVTVDNSDGTLLPGLTVNAEIEVSKREGVLKVANAALRYKPADADETPPAAGGARAGGRGGMDADLARAAAALDLDAAQQAAFDAALEAIRQRQAARQPAAASEGGNRLFGGGMRGGGNAGGGAMQAQFRQRMRERMQQDFAAFRASLPEAKQRQWDASLLALVGATRAPIWLLVDGRPQRTMVRVGASDGSDTEISGNIRAGDVVVTGERAAR